MSTTYSTALKLALMGTGDQSGTWGQTNNTNIGTLLEQAITGVGGINISALGGSTYTLTNYNGTVDDHRNAVLVFTGSPSGLVTIQAPLVNKLYTIVNLSTQTITISASAAGGTQSLSVASNLTVQCFCDAANITGSGAGFYAQLNGVGGSFAVGSNLSVAGNSAITGNETVGGTFTVTGASALNGGATTVTQTSTDNSTKVATTAFVQTAIGGGNVTSAKAIANSGGWNVTPSGTKLYFNYNGSNVGSLDSSGNFIVSGNVTAYGSP